MKKTEIYDGLKLIGIVDGNFNDKILKTAKKYCDEVPDHVKKYNEHNHTYKSTSENKLRTWF